MAKFKIIYYFSDGTSTEDDNYGEYYDSYDEAYDAGSYGLQCAVEGAEIMHMSNPVEYPFDESDFEDDYFEVEEI